MRKLNTHVTVFALLVLDFIMRSESVQRKQAEKSCQGGKTGRFAASDSKQGENKL
jgi:hypothetical protein